MTDLGIKWQRNNQNTRGKRLTSENLGNQGIHLSVNAPFQIMADFSFRSAGVAVR